MKHVPEMFSDFFTESECVTNTFIYLRAFKVKEAKRQNLIWTNPSEFDEEPS